MTQGMEFVSAVLVRLGIGGGAILGGFAGSWIGTIGTPAAGGEQTWPVVVGAVGGFVAAWIVLTWMGRRHRGAGAIAGGVLTVAAAVALLARFAWQRGG
jgi:hypothetical protein